MTHVLSPYAIYMKARRLLKKGNNKNDSNKKEEKRKKTYDLPYTNIQCAVAALSYNVVKH